MKKVREIGNRILKDMKSFGWAAGAILIYYLIVRSVFGAFCPLLLVTGIPCAGCGLTRAGLYLLQGQIMRAVYINPMIFPVLGVLLYCGFWRYIRGARIRGLKIVIILLVAVMVIFYVFRMGIYFPHRVPYVYYSNNILARTLPGYRAFMEGFIH